MNHSLNEDINMKMLKCLTGILAALLFTTGAFAQTAEEIVARAETQMNQPTDDGYYMVMEMKIPLIGTFGTQAYTRGDKMRLEMNKDGKQVITYIDGETEWEYDSSKNEVTIKTAKSGSTKVYSSLAAWRRQSGTEVGVWVGTFDHLTADDAADESAYRLQAADGNWSGFTYGGTTDLPAFRAYLSAPGIEKKEYTTRFTE